MQLIHRTGLCKAMNTIKDIVNGDGGKGILFLLQENVQANVIPI